MIKLDPLKGISQIEGEYEFKTVAEEGEAPVDDGDKAKIKVTVKINSPLVTKEYITSSKVCMKITKTFPPFKGDQIDGDLIDNYDKPTTINEVKKDVKKAPVNEPKAADAQKPVQRKPTVPLQIDPNDFKKEEIENPDHIDNLVSLKVLEFKIKKVEEEIKNIEGRAPPVLRDKLLRMRVKHKVNEWI